LERPYLKKTYHKNGLVEWLKVEALGSNSSTTKKKKKKNQRKEEEGRKRYSCVCVCSCKTRDGTQSFRQVRQVLYNWATPLALLLVLY
jgi:hypothetical protein